MRTIEVKLYPFNELSDEAKERAIQDWRQRDTEFLWDSEWRESLKRAGEALGFRAKDWQVTPYGNSFVRIQTTLEEEVAELAGVRAWKWLQNNVVGFIGANDSYPFTGCGMDETLLKPLREFLHRPTTGTTIGELLKDCVDAWVWGFQQDMEFQDSDEYISETLEANDYEFTENGEMV